MLVGATLALAALAACSGGDDDADVATTEPPAQPSDAGAAAADLEPAVRAYTEAFLGGDPDGAFELLSQRCHGEVAPNEWASMIAQATDTYGDAQITSYSENIDGQIATVSYELTDPVLNQTEERWVLEDGAWRNDECP